MTHLLHLGLSNAAVAGLIAVVAAVVTWRARGRPALACGLWSMVLLKLLTPPLVGVSLSWPAPSPEPEGEEEPIAEASCPAPQRWHRAEVIDSEDIAPTPAEIPIDWPMIVAGAWAAGSLAFAALTAWRIRRLVRWLRCLDEAPAAWQGRVDRLADRLGLWRSPRLLIAPHAAVPPLVVGLGGRAALVFPLELWHRLEEPQRDAVLLHELAHLRRGDHRVRLLELAALTLYWWFPLAWWASRRLRQAEEECCDAWVVWAAPDARPAYASALVETVAFLSGRPPSLPIGASGVGPVVALKRRLSVILQEQTPRGLSRLGWALMLAGLALMPLMPTLAQSQPKVEQKSEATRAPLTMPGLLSMKSCIQCHESPKAAKAVKEDPKEDLHGKIIHLMDALRKQRDMASKTEWELREALAKFEKSQEKPKPNKAAKEQERLDREVKELREKVDQLKRALEEKREKPQKEEEVSAEYGNMHIAFVKVREIKIPYIRTFPMKPLILFMRTGTKKEWKQIGRSTTQNGEFPFTAPGDGVYEFAIRSEGREEGLPVVELQPNVVVVVDTVAPVIGAEWYDKGDRTFELHWSIKESHPDLSTLRVEYRLEGEKEWRKFDISPSLEGKAKLDAEGKVAAVRLRMKDKAGNEGETILKREAK